MRDTFSHKTLRYYHRVGILQPADVDPHTGYRRYQTDQIRSRRSSPPPDLDTPLGYIRAVLAARITARDELIASHLRRLESTLERTQQATAPYAISSDPDSGHSVTLST